MLSHDPASPAQPQEVVIYGTRGFAREVHQLIEDMAADGSAVACAGFLVDTEFRESSTAHDLPVFGDADWLATNPDVVVTIAIGATETRHRIARYIEDRYGPRFVTLRHPRAWVGRRVALGQGSLVAAGALVTSDISVGRLTHLHVGCTIGHDTTIGDFVTVAPGANISGRVRIGDGTFVGVGAVIINDIKVGSWSMLGGGAVITRDVPDNVVVAGNPAQVISEYAPGWHLVRT